jgi:hypothetical protein
MLYVILAIALLAMVVVLKIAKGIIKFVLVVIIILVAVALSNSDEVTSSSAIPASESAL